MELNAREVAIVVWTFGFVLWSVWKSPTEIGRGLWSVLRAASHPKVAWVLVALAFYASGVVWALAEVGLWDDDLLKDTVLWFGGSGTTMGVSAVLNDGGVGPWRKVVRDQVTVMAVVTYIANSYVFPLWAELALVPVVTLFGLVVVVEETNGTPGVATRVGTFVITAYGLVLLVLGVSYAASTFGRPEVELMVRSLVLLPVLSVSFAPLLFVLSLLSAYEMLWIRLTLGPPKDPEVLAYAKRRLLLRVGLRPRVAKAFVGPHARDIMHARTRSDVDSVIDSVLAQTL